MHYRPNKRNATILKDSGVLVNRIQSTLLSLQTTKRPAQKRLQAVVLVGGQGTRLRPVVRDLPKPMAKVAGRPFLEWVLLALRSRGVRHAVLCTGYGAEAIESYFQDGASLDMGLSHSREHRPLGTAGAVRQALGKMQSDRFLVLNGDSFCRFDLDRLLKTHLDRRALATLWVVDHEDCRRYGEVVLESDGGISGFAEKASKVRSGLINAGVYLLEREVVDAIPEGREVSLERQVFPRLIGNGLYGVIGHGPFLDIGTPEDYKRADDFIAAEMIS